MKQAQDEMVWIDHNGVAHPLGEVATTRMRKREGAYRMLPTPAHLVLLRFTGNDGRRDLEDGPIVRMAGEITASGDMADVLGLIGQLSARGELVVMEGDVTRSVFFEHGNVVGVQTNAEEERIGMLLYKYGVIGEDQIFPVLERARKGDLFGMSAVELGLVNEEVIYKYLARQVEEVVFAILAATDGAYCFLDGFDEARLASRQVVSATALLMNYLTRIDEIRHLRPWIPSADYVPLRLAPRSEVEREHALVWDAIDGISSVGDIGRATGLGEFDVTKQVFQLSQAQLVAIHPPRLRGGVGEVAELANAALRAIHRAADSGGRGTALRNNLAAFARGEYEPLLRGAGPHEHGGFGAAVLVANSQREAQNLPTRPSHEVETYVREMLYDYVSFALFSATASLTNSSLAAEVEPLLAQLRPMGQSGRYLIGRRGTVPPRSSEDSGPGSSSGLL